jgi:hypothetical protein
LFRRTAIINTVSPKRKDCLSDRWLPAIVNIVETNAREPAKVSQNFK